MGIIKRCVVIIDPQNDFCKPDGALAVPGAEQDLTRISEMIRKNIKNIGDVIVTMDSHNRVDISHPLFWINETGVSVDPFSVISLEDIENKKYRTFYPWMQEKAKDYVTSLKANDRYQLCIWPEHCLIGTPGHNVHDILMDSLKEWETSNNTNTSYFTKGSNIFTEHYSVVQADVPDPNDPGTKVNMSFLDLLDQYDEIWVGGEASSHCVKFSVEDVILNFGPESAKKLVVMEDAMSPVSGFEKAADDFLDSMRTQGIRVLKTTDF